MKFTYFICTIFLFVLSACSERSSFQIENNFASETVVNSGIINEDKEHLQQFLNKLHLEYKENHIYYITEMRGCGYCIDKSIEFAGKTTKDNITFIFSCSGKQIRSSENKLISLKNNDNVILDTKNYAYQYELTNTRPTAFMIGNNSFEKLEFTPEKFKQGFVEIQNF